MLGNDPDQDDRVPEENSVDVAGQQRLEAAVMGAGGTTDVSRRSGVPLGTLRGYLRGRAAKPAALVALADACGVTIEWLAAGRGPRYLDQVEVISTHSVGSVDRLQGIDGPTYQAIPRLNVAASAGGGALVQHPQVVEHMAFAEDFLRLRLQRRPDDLVLIEARGDSMEPTIRDGDILTVDIRPAQPLENGRLYVLQVGDALLVKRLELRLSGLVLHSDNTRYSPETIARTDTEQLHVIGQVLLVSAPPR